MTTKRLPTYTGKQDGHGNRIHNGDILKESHGTLKTVYLQEGYPMGIRAMYRRVCCKTLKPHGTAWEYFGNHRDELWILAEDIPSYFENGKRVKKTNAWCGADCPYCNNRSES